MKYSDDPIFFTVPSGDTKRARILHKGGKGGDGGASKREAERQARIAAGTNAVNSIFGIGGDKTKVPTGQKTLSGYSREYTDNYGKKQYDKISAQDYASMQPVKQTRPFSIFASGEEEPMPVISQSDYKPIYQDVLTEVDSPAALAAQQRQAMYDATKEDTRQFYTGQLEEDSAKARREMNFQKARQGIVGSSQANDLDTDFQKRYDRGMLDVANRADGAATQFRTSDEQARLNLIAKVVAGLDQGTAAQNAMSTLQTNQNAAKEAYQSQRMGNVFGDLLGAYNQNQYNQGAQAGRTQSTNQYGNFFANDQSESGKVT